MDCLDYPDMVHFESEKDATQCVVFDQTPDSEQKKINVVVRPAYTVAKVIADVKIQYHYDKFDLLLQPIYGGDLVYLNDLDTHLLYKVAGFEPQAKNSLVLLPPGKWDGNVKTRYDLTVSRPRPTITNTAVMKNAPSTDRDDVHVTDCTITSKLTSNNHNNNNNNNNSNNMNFNNDKNISNSSADINSILTILNSSIGQVKDGSVTTNSRTGYAVVHNASPPSSVTTVTNATNTDSLELSPISEPEALSDDDLALGASASPVEVEPTAQCGSPSDYNIFSNVLSRTDRRFGPLRYQDTRSSFDQGGIDFGKKYPLSPLPSVSSATVSANSNNNNNNGNNGYVGLVNQAMTCYLNSLLQALYMTPEFRNALYRWEFDNDNEAKNIPYQLQKLFLNLQTSKKSAVETTDLTRSFGWNSSEAWQQHDIQELCRVMFDALEHKFRNTSQINLIANLYEGKMIDYVKCLECNTEKTREDTFLDIPLPVRPFGSAVAYGSIEEALRAFVQPETLDGNNQYFCEKCNKKCDAHKGLKFKNFPYILTLHLKRFDFDYQTMHRIKLNDKVTFPQNLNLNSFTNTATGISGVSHSNGGMGAVTMDDCSTTDSGSAMEEDNWSSGVATTVNSTPNETDMNDEDQDEGIDISSSTDHRNRGINSIQQQSGPYIYQLFAIMIHSGSASGGHYYAYIKEFDDGQWYCFNDQSVNSITQEDIQKSFGGGANKAYYSSVYSSSTNAYMLMYRQIDAKRNERALKDNEFPEHLKLLTERLKQEEELRNTRGGVNAGSSVRHRPITDLALPEQIKPRVYFYNPQRKKLKMVRVYVSQKFDIKAILESAYQMLGVEQFAPLTHCRLVAYDPPAEHIICSFENIHDPTLSDVRASFEDPFEFLLEYRADGQDLEIYEPGGSTWSVFMVNLSTMEMDGPYFVYSQAFENNAVLRHSIAMRLHVKGENLLVAITKNYKKAFVAYHATPTPEAQEHLQQMVRSQFKDITYFFLNVPSTEPANLELIDIPTTDVRGQLTPVANATPHDECLPPYTPTFRDVPIPVAGPLPADAGSIDTSKSTCGTTAASNAIQHESNSEDSSLSDGDRTLVESVQNRGGGDSQVSSTSHSPQVSSPEDDRHQEYMKRIDALYDGFFALYNDRGSDQEAEVNSGGDGGTMPAVTPQFFHAIKLEAIDTATVITSRHHTYTTTTDDPDSFSDEAVRKPVHSYKIFVDGHMTLGTFKTHIERLINVPAHYFQIYRNLEKNINMSLSLIHFNEGDAYSVELGRDLLPDERRAKIYFMRLSELSNHTGRLPCVCEWIYTDATPVTMAKRKLVAKLQRIDAKKYKTLTEGNCRLWLKGGRSPIKIYHDVETLGSDVRSSASTEFLVQECEGDVAPPTNEDSLTIFVRRWHPDTLELDKFQEITLHDDSEIRDVLSKLSGIPTDRVAYTKVNGCFPNTNVSLLSINSAMSWFSTPATLDKYPLTSTVTGNVYFYKDVIAAAKELTSEERRELSVKEKTRLERLGCSTAAGFSPRRERALKIYLDSPTSVNAPASITPPVDADSTMVDDFS